MQLKVKVKYSRDFQIILHNYKNSSTLNTIHELLWATEFINTKFVQFENVFCGHYCHLAKAPLHIAQSHRAAGMKTYTVTYRQFSTACSCDFCPCFSVIIAADVEYVLVSLTLFSS